MELIGQGKAKLSLLPMVGEALSGLAQASGKQKLRRVIQKMRILALFVLPPAIKVPGRDDRGGEEIVKETLQCHFIGDEAVGAAAAFGFLCALDRLVVATLEGVTLAPLPLNQRVADKHFTGELGGSDWALLGDRKRRICWNSASD